MRHLMFCIADHFEPVGNTDTADAARQLVQGWVADYARVRSEFRDADGRAPRHTFFYPEEEYDRECLDGLASLCREGHGEVEVHLHHRNDTTDGLRSKLINFRDILQQQHGFLGRDVSGVVRYGFIHGNWALCNSRPDGDWCGVDQELSALSATGCYADFTFPSAPSPTQPRMVNAIYRATDTPGRPRGHDRGTRSRVRRQGCTIPPPHGRGAKNPTPPRPPARTPLLLIQGPLATDWRRRKWGVLPRLENGDITAVNPPAPRRVDLWVKQGIHVLGRPDWVFVKAHTHGCVPAIRETVLGPAMAEAHAHLQRHYNDAGAWKLHYVTARELYNIVRAAEDGMMGEPGEYRDYEIRRPAVEL